LTEHLVDTLSKRRVCAGSQRNGVVCRYGQAFVLYRISHFGLRLLTELFLLSLTIGVS
jgi:hypothetical protein